ncbi:MAG: endonuclease domain-containing protein [Patescibacteria group bacterium]
MKSVYNFSSLKQLRRKLRLNQTKAEKIIWSKLRNKQFNDLKFYRQYSVGWYILDFYCPAVKLAIEIDGGQHNEATEQIKDIQRDKYLEQQGIKVVRFWNNDVMENCEGILVRLNQILSE